MKKLIALLMLIVSAHSFAYLPKISNWSSDYELTQKNASQMIFDYYINYVWWEDEGYECGGDFSNGTLLSTEGDTYVIEGNVTVNQNYCAYASFGYYKVKIEKVEGKYEVAELEFDENQEL